MAFRGVVSKEVGSSVVNSVSNHFKQFDFVKDFKRDFLLAGSLPGPVLYNAVR